MANTGGFCVRDYGLAQILYALVENGGDRFACGGRRLNGGFFGGLANVILFARVSACCFPAHASSLVRTHQREAGC